MYYVLNNSPAVAFCYDNSSPEYKKLPENKMIIIETIYETQEYKDIVIKVDKKIWSDVIKTYKSDLRFFNVIEDIKNNAVSGTYIYDFIRVFEKEGWLLFVPRMYTIIKH